MSNKPPSKVDKTAKADTAGIQADAVFYTIASAGHVDHGKTSLIKALTGINPDRLKEEIERQMTTDLGFAHFKPNQNTYIGIIDVPGHERFLKNMLAGVGGIDIALLVVALDEGPKPQTHTHMEILSLLGLKNIVVALNKSDLCNQNRIDEVKAEIEKLAELYALNVVAHVPISATNHTGIDELKATLAKCLRTYARPQSDNCFEDSLKANSFKSHPLKLYVDRVFQKAGFGTIIAGTVSSGSFSNGDSLIIQPQGESIRVRTMQSYGHSCTTAKLGQRVAFNVVTPHRLEIERGNLICKQKYPLSKTIYVSLNFANKNKGDYNLQELEGQAIRLYHGTAEHHGHIRFVEASDSKGKQAQTALAYISLDTPMAAEVLDRFILRSGNDVILGGSILAMLKPNRSTRKEWMAYLFKRNEFLASGQFTATDSATPNSTTTQVPPPILIEPALEALLSISPIDAKFLPFLFSNHEQNEIENLIQNKRIRQIENFLLPNDQYESIKAAILDLCTKEISQNDLITKIKDESILQKPLLLAILQSLVKDNLISSQSGQISKKKEPSAASSSAKLSEVEKTVLSKLSETTIIEIDTLCAQTGLDLKTMKSTLSLLASKKLAFIVNYDFAAGAEYLKEVQSVLVDLFTKEKNISPSRLRECLGISRKYTMPLLAYFDDNLATRRTDSGRILLKRIF